MIMTKADSVFVKQPLSFLEYGKAIQNKDNKEIKSIKIIKGMPSSILASTWGYLCSFMWIHEYRLIIVRN